MSEDTQEQRSPLDMTDEELLSLDFPEEVEETEEVDENSAENSNDTPDEENSDEETSDEEDETVEDNSSEEDDKEEKESTDAENETQSEDSEETAENEKLEEKDDKDVKETVNYESQVKELFEPFKANNRDISINSIKEARMLMQMGANYNKKMAGLKPNLKLLKMLENNKLLDEEKLSFLIDLDKKNPDAIKKLLKESGVDPQEVDIEEDINYKPNAYTVNDAEVDLDTVLSDIKDSDTYKSTLDVISNKWDDASKRQMFSDPNIIRVINDHMGNGIYDEITTVVEREKMLGRLNGVSDLQAYLQIGNGINERQGFKNQQSSNEAIKPIIEKKVDPKLKERKKAASGTKNTKSVPKKGGFNPLSMTDEEFNKAAGGDFLVN